MGFCRRCGNIVSDGPFCKCGGTAVAGLVANRVNKSPSPDRWRQVYTKNASPTRSNGVSDSQSGSFTPIGDSPIRRITALSTVGVHTSILASRSTPSSPTKSSSLSSSISQTPEPEDEADITLTNIFGSMLQDTDSFTKHACAECAMEFPPDSTIYPHPVKADSGNTYLCYTCFLLNGGSKGECGSCGRHVLILKSEGKFVKYAERVWHASCFRCRGCLKDLSSNPAVDLLGIPCCSICFDTTETKPGFNPKPISGSIDPSDSEVLIDELAHKLQSCSPASSPKRSTPRRLSSARNSPSTTPIRSARRLSSRGEHKQSPRAVSGNGQLPKGENAGSGVKRFAKPTMRALDRDVFGPVQVNGVSLESKMCMDNASTSGNPVLKTGSLTIETNPENSAQASASRFGTSTTCPGCHRAVSPMERGVVPGPQGTRWHSNCLVCGGKRSQPSGKHDGCGKKLDSSAKTDKAGRLFCRNCLNGLPRDMRPSPQTSPIRMGASGSTTGSSIFASRGLGISTLVKQMTGNGTSTGFSPTRSLARSPSPPPRDLSSPPGSPSRHFPVTRHMTGNNITKLTQQLTGSGLIFLTGGAPPALEGNQPLAFEEVGFSANLGSRSASPDSESLDTVAEEEPSAPSGRREIKFVPTLSRNISKGGIERQTIGRSSPTRQLNGGSISPTRTAFSRRPKSLLSSRHGHHKSLDEREGRGMFLVRQLTGNGA